LGKWGGILRLVPLVVILALTLSACGFSTDTVATVGGERITRGELNALVSEQRAYAELNGQQAPSDANMMQYLVSVHLLELSAREQKISVTLEEVDAKIAELIAQNNRAANSSREQMLSSLATSTVRQIRPLVNAYGGAAVADASLQTATQAEITNLVNLLNARGTTMPMGSSTLPERTITDQAIAYRNALAGQGVGLPPTELEPVISDLIQQLESGGLVGMTAADDFQLYVTQQGYTSTSFREAVKIQVLLDKLSPTQVNAAFFQAVTTDSSDKANEIVQKARAGTPFADLIKQYQLSTIATTGPENLLQTSFAVGNFPAQLAAAFKAIAPGEVSNPIPSADNKQFTVYRITKIEPRAPTDDDLNNLLGSLLEQAQQKYPVVYVDKSLEPITVAP
jgi:PPIC-type PPIASE domain/SurA-like N-terminal domain